MGVAFGNLAIHRPTSSPIEHLIITDVISLLEGSDKAAPFCHGCHGCHGFKTLKQPLCMHTNVNLAVVGAFGIGTALF